MAQNSEHLLRHGLDHLSPLTILLVFSGGLLTSLGPCSLSLLPITIAYLAGFEGNQSPFLRSLIFSSGIVSALVVLGGLSSLVGKIYGQVPDFIGIFVALLALFMGLNLLGLWSFQLPVGPDPRQWQKKVPMPIAPFAAGLAFGLAASPCTTPVLAVLIGWIAQSRNPLIAIPLLASFGIGQVAPLILAGTMAASTKNLMALRPMSQWIPPISGAIFITIGLLSLGSRLI